MNHLVYINKIQTTNIIYTAGFQKQLRYIKADYNYAFSCHLT